MKHKFWLRRVLAVMLSIIVCICCFPATFVSTAYDNETIIYDYLRNTLQLNVAAACGVLGNIAHETAHSFSPTAYNSGENAWGLCQWEGGRLTNLQNQFPSTWKTLDSQLAFLKWELEGGDYAGPKTLNYLRSLSDTADDAYNGALYFAQYFERCASSTYVYRTNLARDTYWPKYSTPVSHDIDDGYDKDFTAFLKDPNTNHYVFDANHNQTSGYVNGNDPVTIHEVYTDGCCKFTYILDNGSYRTAYGKISWFNTITRDTRLLSWITTKGEGYNYKDAFPSVDNGTTQTLYYFWFALLDANTLDLYNSYKPGKSYTVTISVKYEDGSDVRSTYTYSNSDANWVGFTPKKSGKITATATITGDVKGSTSASFTIDYSAGLKQSASSVSLNMQGTNTKTLTFTPTGGYPGSKGVDYTVDTNIVNVDSKGWSDGVFSMTLSGKKNGTTNLVVKLYENYTGNKNVVATATVKITVAGQTFKLSYDANGGTGAPSSHTGTTLTIKSTMPTRTGYSFLGWSTSSSQISPEYVGGNSITLTENTTLYAVWSRVGKAPYWGDVNGDLYIDYRDVTLVSKFIAGTQTPTTEQACFGDVNLDGKISITDLTKISEYSTGSLSAFPCESVVDISVVPAKTQYTKGEVLKTNGTKIQVKKQSSTISYELTDNISISGYNPNTVGTQTLTATYRGLKLTFTVTVKDNATYTLSYNPNGGSGAPSDQTGATSYTIPSGVPTRFGYTFLGWAKNSGATSADYAPGNTISLTANTTLYAVWKSATTVSTGSTYSPNIAFGYQAYYYKYTPSTTGTYVIESTGSLDSKVELYNASGTLISSNDDGGTDSNFKLSSSLTAGTTYYIKVFAYNAKTGTTNFSVTLTQSVKKGDLNGDGVVDAGDAVLISRYDAGLITLTSAQLAAADLNNDNVVDAGDAVIISRFDAGLIQNF